MNRILLNRRKQRKRSPDSESGFFAAFVCFYANSIPTAARMENSQSVKSVKSVVHSFGCGSPRREICASAGPAPATGTRQKLPEESGAKALCQVLKLLSNPTQKQ
jgi:hypothetical protein